MTNLQEDLTEQDSVERRKLIKELAKAKRPEEMKEIKDKILEGLTKKVDEMKQLIRENE